MLMLMMVKPNQRNVEERRTAMSPTRNLLMALLLLCAGGLARVQGAASAAGEKPASPKEEKDYPDFKEVTEGMKDTPGMFTLWSYPDAAKGKDKEKLLCQIPASFLGRTFMLSTSVAGGGFYTGFPLTERAVKWQEFNRSRLLSSRRRGTPSMRRAPSPTWSGGPTLTRFWPPCPS
jgi:hypothetical protein